MGSIRALEMKLVDQLFEKPGDRGYVLDLSNVTFASFFGQELGVQIYDDRYSGRGTSKMNRLRCYLEVADDAHAAQALTALWEYRETLSDSFKIDVPNGERRLNALIVRLGGKSISTPSTEPERDNSPHVVAPATLEALRSSLIALTALEPRTRGLQFEKFLGSFFNAHGMAWHGSINNRGEQIDGSFQLDSQTYLVEAKWQNEKIGAADLHIFEGKLSERPTWTRGVFISQSGFTDEGLHAFGRGKHLICMDGLDLWETLSGPLALPDILRRKVTRASQTGELFVRVRDLV